MTLREFYTALEQALRDDPAAHPDYTSDGAMRLYLDALYPHCPITYLALRRGQGRFDTADVDRAAAALGLPTRTRQRLVKAADNLSQSQTRQRLETLWRKTGSVLPPTASGLG